MSADPREAIALFRYAVVCAATNLRLTPAERGPLVRELASQAHAHPDGSQWTYSRGTLDRWIRAYREQGLDGLRPPPRADQSALDPRCSGCRLMRPKQCW